MRWLALLLGVALFAGAAEARVYRCTDGMNPLASKRSAPGACDADGVADGVCTFTYPSHLECLNCPQVQIQPVPLNGHQRVQRRVGRNRFVCNAAGSERPVITLLADPCSEICTFNLCLTGDQLQLCPSPCRSDYRVSVPASKGAGLVTFASLDASTPNSATATLRCQFDTLACGECFADSECDDGQPDTHDICRPAGAPGPGGRCFHFCAGEDPTATRTTSTSVTTTSTSVTSVTHPLCPTTSTLGRPDCGGNFCGPFPCFSGQACVDLGNGTCGCAGPVLCGGFYNVCGGECPSDQTCAAVPVPEGCPSIGCACASTATTTTTLPTCASACSSCAMDAACIVTTEGAAVCINAPCQWTGCTASAQCPQGQVCDGAQCCPLCP